MKTSKVLLNLSAFFCFIYFALYIFTLVFIPIGIYCFLAGKRFNYKAEHLGDTTKISNKEFKFYVIFVSVFCFPFGLLSIIPYVMLVSNRVKVSDLNYVDTRDIPVEELKTETNNENISKEQETSNSSQNVQEETEEEKLEKFKKLENFKEKGLITADELEQAREQLFGKKDEE